jgi:hypothetical protein
MLAEPVPEASDGQYPSPMHVSPLGSVQEGVTLATVAPADDAVANAIRGDALMESAKALEATRKRLAYVALCAAINSAAVTLTEIIFLILNSTFHSVDRSWTATSVPLAVSLSVFALRCSGPLEKIAAYNALCFIVYNALVFVSFWAFVGFVFEIPCVVVRSTLAKGSTGFFRYSAVVSAVFHGVHMLLCLAMVLCAKKFANCIEHFVDVGGVLGSASGLGRAARPASHRQGRVPVTGVVLAAAAAELGDDGHGAGRNRHGWAQPRPAEDEEDAGHAVEQPVVLLDWFQRHALATTEGVVQPSMAGVAVAVEATATSPEQITVDVAEVIADSPSQQQGSTTNSEQATQSALHHELVEVKPET